MSGAWTLILLLFPRINIDLENKFAELICLANYPLSLAQPANPDSTMATLINRDLCLDSMTFSGGRHPTQAVQSKQYLQLN